MVIRTNDMSLTQSLHIIRAHLLHYASLLEDFKKSVVVRSVETILLILLVKLKLFLVCIGDAQSCHGSRRARNEGAFQSVT